MSRATLLRALEVMAEAVQNDPEAAHGEADRLLIEYINDPEITRAYDAIEKWYDVKDFAKSLGLFAIFCGWADEIGRTYVESVN